MRLAKVIGNIICTVKNPELHGAKLLLIQPINVQRHNVGKTMVAVDSIGAGVGEIVIWCRGKEASFPFDPQIVPTDCTITGIVDTTNVSNRD